MMANMQEATTRKLIDQAYEDDHRRSEKNNSRSLESAKKQEYLKGEEDHHEASVCSTRDI